MDSLMNFFDASRPLAILLSYFWCAFCVVREALLGSACFHHHDGNVTVVEFATCNNEFECCSSPSSNVGCAIHSPSWLYAKRTAPIGPSNGMPEIMNDADAALIAKRRVGFLVGTNNRDDDLCFVAVAIWESWAQWAVGESASKNCCLAWAAFTTEE
jgi:hypothetical protein